RLFRNGILLQDGTGLERLSGVDRIVFDKTGTLTDGKIVLQAQLFGSPDLLPIAAAIGATSTHLLSQALAASVVPAELSGVAEEIAGAGVEFRTLDAVWRLGSAAFCTAIDPGDDATSRVYLARDGVCVAAFAFKD